MPHLLTTPTDVYQHIFKLLLLPDALIILGCLEALYCLTFSCTEMARNILGVAKSVQVLVDLLSVDLGNEALKNIKVFEKKPTGTQLSSVTSTTSKSTLESTKSSSNALSKSVKISNTPISSVQLPSKQQVQLSSSPLNKVLTSTSGFIPVLSIQQLQELLARTKPASPLSGGTVKTTGAVTTAVQSSKIGTVVSKVQSPFVAMVTEQSSSADSEQFTRQW